MKWITVNKTHLENLLDCLLSATAYPFNPDLEAKLPEKHGVYAISIGEDDGMKFVWVGMTHRSKRGLRRRIWEDHYKNPTSTSDLPNVLMRAEAAWNLSDAKRWIGETCRVRWIEVEDEKTRALLEHYATALLQPNPTAGFD